MKKIMYLFLVCILFLCIPFTSFASSIDVSSMTDEDLVTFIDSAQAELNRRGALSSGSENNVTVAPGSIVAFGQYVQDNNGKEASPIEWIVLDVVDNKCLIVSRVVIDAQPFNSVRADVTWETSTLRKWLNNEFVQTAFSIEELTAIQSTHVSNADNEGAADWSYDGGNDTEDKVFLLSYSECNKYFSSLSDWYTNPSEYAKSKGTYSSMENEYCSWWLRSKGNSSYTMLNVDDVNPVDHVMNRVVENPGGGIRPALWLDLSALP